MKTLEGYSANGTQLPHHFIKEYQKQSENIWAHNMKLECVSHQNTRPWDIQNQKLPNIFESQATYNAAIEAMNNEYEKVWLNGTGTLNSTPMPSLYQPTEKEILFQLPW